MTKVDYNKMSAVVKGVTEDKEAFTDTLNFTLLPPVEKSYYGTGYYMTVEQRSTLADGKLKQYVDVRYERTTDIEILADRWIKNYYGNNAQEVKKCFGVVE